METCDIDISPRGNHTVILTGRYKNHGYVRFYDVGHEEFIKLVEEMRYKHKHGYYRNIDASPNIKAFFKWD